MRSWISGSLLTLALARGACGAAAATGGTGGAGGAMAERLEPWCVQLYEATRESPTVAIAPAEVAQPAALPDDSSARLLAEGRLRLEIDTGPGGPDAADLRRRFETGVPRLAWEGAWGRVAQVTLPIDELPGLAAVPGLFYAHRPARGMPLEAIVSAGVAQIGADAYGASGIDGAGIRIGVIDLGYAGLGDLLGTELPAETRTRSFYGSPQGNGDLSGGGDSHGTACAEIIHDVAPGATLFLTNALTTVEFQAAVRWLRDQGVAVISHSVGWFDGGGDGTGPIHEIVAEALDAGIVWVNAAGNQALDYWGGGFVDADGDSLTEFDATGDETITYPVAEGGATFSLVLTWDRWPYSTDLAFDIEIYEDGQLVASSAPLYQPRYAYRGLAHARRPGSRLEIAIRRTLGTDAAHLRLFRLDAPERLGEHATSEGSLLIPADGARVIAVGAYRATDGRLEEFSSRGPSLTGAPKPEVCAPDFVRTASASPFIGTSAAAPHAAGAVALLLATSPEAGFFDFRWSAQEIRRVLAAAAQPDTFADPNAAAWGLLRLPDPRPQPMPRSRAPLILTSPTRIPLEARLCRPMPGAWSVEILDAAGRRVGMRALPPMAAGQTLPLWDGRTLLGAPAASGRYFLRLSGADGAWRAAVILVR
jgi:subtilisin family serine protease